MTILNVNNLNIGYDNEIINKNINFSLNKGDYMCVVGENGAGKSTLMKTLIKLINPISGEITYPESNSKYNIGYVPQQAAVQTDFPATVWEIVLSGTLARFNRKFFYTKEAKNLAQAKIEQLSIADLKNKSYSKLSGGQQQRVLLARALCVSDQLLVLDEPTQGLDPKVTKEFYQLIDNLNTQGMTIVLISHDIKAAVKHANKILHLGKNKQLFSGTKDQYLSSRTFKFFTEEEEWF